MIQDSVAHGIMLLWLATILTTTTATSTAILTTVSEAGTLTVTDTAAIAATVTTIAGITFAVVVALAETVALTAAATPTQSHTLRSARLRFHRPHDLREMGGVPRNPAPMNQFWCGLSNHQAATAMMGTRQAEFSLEINKYPRVPTPLESTSPFSDPTPSHTSRSARLRFRRPRDWYWAGPFIPMPMPEPVCRTSIHDKWNFSGQGYLYGYEYHSSGTEAGTNSL